jgi:hypothetical protein
MYELQEELQIYQRECIKLRKISENALHLLMQNGLEFKLKGFKSTNWQPSFLFDAESIFDHKSPSTQSNAIAKHQTSTSVNTSPIPPYGSENLVMKCNSL